MVVIGLGKNVLFKSVLAHCEGVKIFGELFGRETEGKMPFIKISGPTLGSQLLKKF